MDYLFYLFIAIFLFSGVIGNSLVATNKLSLATWGSYHMRDHKGPGTYAFGYDIEDPVTGNVQFKQEERHPNGTVTGNYGYVDANGRPHVVTYVSDERGYRAKVEVEGDPPKYYPDVGSFWGNSIENQPIRQKKEYNFNEIQIPNDEIVYVENNEIPPPLPYRLVYPTYLKYARVNQIFQ